MKKVLILIITVASLFLQSSCTKEEPSVTQAELTTAELKNVINEKKPQRIIAIGYNETFPNSFPSSTGVNYSFSNGFIFIDGYERAFNLSYLKAYNLANVMIFDGGVGGSTTTSSALILYFQ